MRMGKVRYLLYVVIVLMLSGYSHAQVPSLKPIPEDLSKKVKAQLNKKATELKKELDVLKQRNTTLKENCVEVIENSPDAVWCAQEQAALEVGKTAYVKKVNEFNQAVDNAVTANISFEFNQKLQSKKMWSEPINAPLTNDMSNRSAYNYFKVIEQFEVESSARYKKDNFTYCNIFVWDVTRAMNAEIPFWVIKKDRNGKSGVDRKGKFVVGPKARKAMRVNDMAGWLKEHGGKHGWRRVDARMAQEKANEGAPAIVLWENPKPKESGHIAVIRPGSVGDKRGVAISQAGNSVLDARHILKGFWSYQVKEVQYWYHE